MRNYLFLKNYITSEGAVSHNNLYYEQISIARYQVSFYANNSLSELPIGSSALSGCVRLGPNASILKEVGHQDMKGISQW